jgi:hypothetical protein
MGRDSVVDIASACGLEGLGIEPVCFRQWSCMVVYSVFGSEWRVRGGFAGLVEQPAEERREDERQAEYYRMLLRPMEPMNNCFSYPLVDTCDTTAG